jgi:serine/threonine-protein kinase
VHRDLKPDNVFLTRHASGAFIVKVLDFGIAKVMEAAGGMGSRTRSGMLLGTAAYMSPEQVRNASNVDQRADLWSAGVMLYEMLTGRVAFPAPTEYARLAAVLTSEPEPIARIDPALAPLAQFIAHALQKERDARFSTALEMARALAALNPGEATRVEAGVSFFPPSTALPLSRLPDVASLFAPSPSPFAPPLSALAHTTAAPGSEPKGGRQKPGGTLASAVEPHDVVESPLQVAILGPGLPESLDGTLPSKDLPAVVGRALKLTRSRSPAAVVMLVAAALLAGFFLGWLFARLM